jgi:hypothetical protein
MTMTTPQTGVISTQRLAGASKSHLRPGSGDRAFRSGLKVLEIGFGGAATLSWMAQQDAIAHGQEVVKSNRDGAVRLGIPPARVKGTLDDFRGESFDLILYLDAFELIFGVGRPPGPNREIDPQGIKSTCGSTSRRQHVAAHAAEPLAA